MKNNMKKIYMIISILAFIGFMVFVTFTVGTKVVELSQDPTAFKGWIDSYGIIGQLMLVGLMALQVIVAFIPGEMIEIGAGYAFGPMLGTILCLIGAAVGSSLIFLLVKTFGIKMAEVLISKKDMHKIRFLENEAKLNSLLFISFFIPGTPKDLLTYFVGLTKMKLSTFLLITSFARIPSVITSTFGGDALVNKNYTLAIIIFAITAVISIFGLWYYNYYMRAKQLKAYAQASLKMEQAAQPEASVKITCQINAAESH